MSQLKTYLMNQMSFKKIAIAITILFWVLIALLEMIPPV
jgi:hypothetical protein